jgi:FAD/FMN-containing dehydrogenase
MEGSLIKDGILAENETQLQTIWQMREGIAEAAGKTGKVYKYDLSLPLDVMYEVVEDVRERFRTKGMLGPDGDGSIKEVVGYGHLGDGRCCFW